MRKIMVVTGSRAEYGILSGLCQLIKDHSTLDLCLAVTGTHLDEQYGSTESEILQDGFDIDFRVPLSQGGDSPLDVSRAVSIGIAGFANVFDESRPDIIVVLGDRFELLCPAIAALLAGIPLAHIAGGHLTEGTMDDVIRHSLTKMSHLHFTSTEIYARRIVQLGENPNRVFVTGSLGLDNIYARENMSRQTLATLLGTALDEPICVVTFHPSSFDPLPASVQMTVLLEALNELENKKIIFTMPDADPHNSVIREAIESFSVRHAPRVVAFESLGRKKYHMLLSHAEMVVGNSSSGLIEVPSFGIPTVNIGDRQKGRIRPDSVIDCNTEVEAIRSALDKAQSEMMKDRAKKTINPFGDGQSARRVVRVLAEYDLSSITAKSFFDIAIAQRFELSDL